MLWEPSLAFFGVYLGYALLIGGALVAALFALVVGGGGGQVRRDLVSGLHVRCGREHAESDRHEFPPGQARHDRHRQDHGPAGGPEHRPAAGHEHRALGSPFPGGGRRHACHPGAIIAAHRAGIDLDFDRAAAIDLAGRDVLDAVRTSVFPKVIDCPEPQRGGKTTLSAVAKNGVELRIHVRVTVRTNLDQLIGGATEETIIARVGQGIITAIGSSRTHMEVLAMPDRISKGVLDRGLDANTAFEIVSIDIADIDVGENIGARLQTDQAEADMRMARARAEARRAEAIACQQEMTAQRGRAAGGVVLAEAQIPAAMALALRAGRFQIPRPPVRRPEVCKEGPRPASHVVRTKCVP